ncbi:hypothetical protein Clacol_008575 [Clathrus columnatus]|uniref:Uncharacterized protein n=1 Tax=Clathrus columnatus TaxID=1419009 RepID=A0AAV5AI43_9AGAM|nr:hypothetical protein Clacol_008575 [Clathrus columnatus]
MSIYLQRRPHTRRALPVVLEMDEELEDYQLPHSRRRPRPAPIFTPYHALPILFDTTKSTQTPLSFLEKDPDFSLSPSLLLSRRKSETVLEFPVPAKHTPQTPAPVSSPESSPPRYSSASPISSNSSSSSYPDTPDTPLTDSEEERQNAQTNDVFASTTTVPTSVRRQPYRTPSALSLKSFGTAEFDAHAAGIYNLLRSSPSSPPPSAPLPTRPDLRREVSAIRNIPSESITEEWVDVDSELVRIPRQSLNDVKRRPSIVLSIQDGPTETTLEIPIVFEGNFLDIDASDEDSEEIEFEFDDVDAVALPPLSLTDGLVSSDEESDEADRRSRSRVPRPSRAYDPDMAYQIARRNAIEKPQLLVLPSLPNPSPSSPSSLAPAPSPVPSTKSSFRNRRTVPPRDSIVPKDIDFDDLASPVDDIRISIPIPQARRTSPSPKPTHTRKQRQSSASPIKFISPFTPSKLLEDDNDADDDEPDRPVLRSRFSSSTLNSLPEPPQSPLASPGRFFARLLRSPTPPFTSKHAPPTPPKAPIRGNTIGTQPLNYRKSPGNVPRSSSLPPLSPSPPGRRPSRSLELYDKPLPHASTKNDLNQKHHANQQVLPSTAKRFPSRSSLESTYSVESSSGISTTSAGSSSSNGLKRPPIPLALFIKN